MVPAVPSATLVPPKPLPLRILNRAGAALGAVGLPLWRLDLETLLAKAESTTGLSDFGDEFFRGALSRLITAFEEEASLTALGRMVARGDLLRLLGNRLRMTDTLRRHPEIEAGSVRAPIFILGLPRTGTTILHELLAQDPANRVPMTWEVMVPWPPPERSTFETDPRIAQVDRHFSGVDRLIPGFQAMHPMGARLPQECVAITAHDFASMLFSTTHRVPGYQAWLDRVDLRPVYAAHRRWLQYFQWKCPADRWVLKSPGHLWSLEELLVAYPDARIVQTHRDPLRVVASLSSLVTLLRSMSSDAIDPHAIGAEWAPRLAAGLEAVMRARDATALPTARVWDIHFRDFIGHEIDTVRALYAHFDLELTAEAEVRMRRFLAANPRDKHGAHRYALAAAGLDPVVERRRFAAYVERFGVAEEPLE
jgi:hypothetical protein